MRPRLNSHKSLASFCCTLLLCLSSRTAVGSQRGEQLWQVDLVEMYLPLLSDCSNTDTLEAAVGAIQNLTACEWQPSIQFREHVSLVTLQIRYRYLEHNIRRIGRDFRIAW